MTGERKTRLCGVCGLRAAVLGLVLGESDDVGFCGRCWRSYEGASGRSRDALWRRLLAAHELRVRDGGHGGAA
jgi:hypothetical protein